MTRQHFEAIAASLKLSRPSADDNFPALMGWRAAMTAVADALGDFNPRFDRKRFIDACGGF